MSDRPSLLPHGYYDAQVRDIRHFLHVSQDSNGWPPDPRVDAVMRVSAFERMLSYAESLGADAARTYMRLQRSS